MGSTDAEPFVTTIELGGVRHEVRRFSSCVATRSADGEIEQLPTLAGQSVGLVRRIRTTREIVSELVEEAARALRWTGNLLVDSENSENL